VTVHHHVQQQKETYTKDNIPPCPKVTFHHHVKQQKKQSIQRIIYHHVQNTLKVTFHHHVQQQKTTYTKDGKEACPDLEKDEGFVVLWVGWR